LRSSIFITAAVLSVAISGCASKTADIQAAYVSPMQFSEYSCAQLAQENNRIASRLNQMTIEQDDRASDDAVATGVAIILFWPAAFFIQGDSQEPEIARMKGEYEAIHQAALRNNCGTFERISPTPI